MYMWGRYVCVWYLWYVCGNYVYVYTWCIVGVYMCVCCVYIYGVRGVYVRMHVWCM